MIYKFQFISTTTRIVNMKKLTVILLLFLLTAVLSLTACNKKDNDNLIQDNNQTSDNSDSNINTDAGVLLTTKSLTVNGTEISAQLSYSNETFNFSNDITVAPNATWVLSLDIYGIHNVITKTAPLNEGSNIFYIHVTTSDQSVTTYTVNIYRNHLYTVTFNANGGTSVSPQRVEEGNIITEPSTSRAGYTFDSWDYNFNVPITSNVVTNAIWNPNTNTKYTIEYYLENESKDGYLEPEVVELYGTTDTIATVERTYEHFTPDTTIGNASGNINGDGSLVLRAYYSRNSYTIEAGTIISTVVDDIECAHSDRISHISLPTSTSTVDIVGNGDYIYGNQVTLAAISKTTALTFTGWYKNGVKVCDDTVFSFTAENDEFYTAKWEPNENTKHYVTYYLENISLDEYDAEVAEFTGIIGREDIIRNYEHFSLECVYLVGFAPDGGLIYSLSYSRNTYTISAKVEYVSDGNINSRIVGGFTCGSDIVEVITTQCNLEYAYGRTIHLKASANEGDIFLGWFDENGIKVCDTEQYSFTVTQDANYVARYSYPTNK